MKVVIIGAGEVGKGLAQTLYMENNDVVMIDSNEKILDDLSETLDIMTFNGNGAFPRSLNSIGIDNAQLLVAVTNSTVSNVLSCQIAKKLNPNIRTICRIPEKGYFLKEKDLCSDDLGIDHLVVPQEECTGAIIDALNAGSLKELVRLSVPEAVVAGFVLHEDSPLNGSQLFNFPDTSYLDKVKICAIWRNGSLIIPKGMEQFEQGDEIYIAGPYESVMEFIEWASYQSIKLENIVIAGASTLALYLAQSLYDQDIDVKIIEPDEDVAEKALDAISSDVLVLNGDITSSDVLEEAGIEKCDIFVSTLDSDENNVLACLLAKRCGAEKVITVINKPDYREIISSMKEIDTCFSPRIAALNSIINLIKGSDRRISAHLHRISADIYEMTVIPKCSVVGKAIRDINCPDNVSFAVVLRGNTILTANGDQVLQVGDHVVLIGESASIKKAEQLFIARTFFSL